MVPEVAALMGVSERAVDDWIERGLISHESFPDGWHTVQSWSSGRSVWTRSRLTRTRVAGNTSRTPLVSSPG
jgi:hypothetical protein